MTSRVCISLTKPCDRCGCPISVVYTGGGHRKYCQSCSPTVAKERAKERRQTPEGKAGAARARLKNRLTPEGRIKANLSVAKYSLTPKGKACKARMNAKRRKGVTDPAAYSLRVEVLRTLQEPCANVKCLAPYKITHQIDHIIALCLGGTDEWSNLQPLCIKCHRKKSAEDIRKLRQQDNYILRNTEGWASRLRHLLQQR